MDAYQILKKEITRLKETINTLEYQILLLEEDIELKLDLIESLHEEIDWQAKKKSLYNFTEEVE